ncbi:MAG: alpha/beta hydrolase [Nitrospiria bacterium]
MERKIDLKIIPGKKTAMVLSEPSKSSDRIVILCHGFMSNKESNTNLALTKRLLDQKISTCCFDFYGHGESDGLFQELTLSQCIKQLEGVLSWAVKNNYSNIGLLGSSFGGLVAILSAAQHQSLSVIGLKCPVSDYPPIWQDRLGEAGMAAWKESGLLSFTTYDGRARLEYRFYEDLFRYNPYLDVAKIKVPTLIVHGDTDRDVPCEQSQVLLNCLQSEKQLVLIPDAGHDFSDPNHFGQMIELLSSFLIKNLVP